MTLPQKEKDHYRKVSGRDWQDRTEPLPGAEAPSVWKMLILIFLYLLPFLIAVTILGAIK